MECVRYRVEFGCNGVTRVIGVELLGIKPPVPAGAELVMLDPALTHICEALSAVGVEFSGAWAAAVTSSEDQALDVVAWRL